MKFFGKKSEKKLNHNQSNATNQVDTSQLTNEDCYIKVLGPGCTKCNTLTQNTKEALKQLGKDICIQKISDFSEIAKYGVMSTPALVLGNNVVSSGKVLSVEEIKTLLS